MSPASLIVILMYMQVYQCINLPGFYDDAHRTETEPPAFQPYLPLPVAGTNIKYTQELRYGTTSLQQRIQQPSVGGYFVTTKPSGASSHITPTSSTPVGTTQNPLENLLDKLYGNDSWRSLLDPAHARVTTPSVTPTNTHNVYQGHEEHQSSQEQFRPFLSGFYNNQISVGQGQIALNHPKPQTTTAVPLSPMKEAQLSHSVLPSTGLSKTQVKGHKAHTYDALKAKEQQPTASVTQFVSSLITSRPHPIVNEQIKPQAHGNTINQWTQNAIQQSNIGKTDNPEAMTSGGIDGIDFDPNKVNTVQNVYNPDNAYNGFVTQTGSDPLNKDVQTSFDANTVNQRYMQDNVNGALQTPPGFTGDSQHALFGKTEVDYRFSAYQEVQPHLFDANALNQALFKNQGLFSGNIQQGSGSAFMKGLVQPAAYQHQQQHSQQHTESQNNQPQPHEYPQGRVYSAPKESQDADQYITTPASMPVRIYTSSMRTKPTAKPYFNFIPGNLFPGQLLTNNEKPEDDVQVGSLKTLPLAANAQIFNANMINAEQNIFNPNDIAWLHQKRDKHGRGQGEDEITSDDMDNNATNIASSTTPVSLLEHANVTESSETVTTDITLHDGNGSSGSQGFKPNLLNIEQGQVSFIPGQLSPAYSGISSNTYENNQQNGALQSGTYGYGEKVTGYNPNSSFGGAGINFNIGQLLGMNKGSSNKSNTGTGNGGFDPNAFNNFLANALTGVTNSTGMIIGAFGMSYGGNGFDPNAVNSGFGNVLGDQNGGMAGFGFKTQVGNSSNNSTSNSNFAGFGLGGFDPNTVNAGFGKSSYGIDGLGDISSFDPYAINQISMQTSNINSDKGNSTSGNSSDMMDYFLGIVSSPGGTGTGEGGYGSAFIGTFNPDSVNKASYDPNKFNEVKLHFDPIEMLSKNPGIDKETLQSAKFDPNNSAYNKPAFSPIDMLLQNPGIDKDTISNVHYNLQKSPGHASIVPSEIGKSNSDQNTKPGSNTAAMFDPFAVMNKLMQNTGQFQPGTVGNQQMSFDPMAMFSNGNQLQTSIVQTTHQPITTNTTSIQPSATSNITFFTNLSPATKRGSSTPVVTANPGTTVSTTSPSTVVPITSTSAKTTG